MVGWLVVLRIYVVLAVFQPYHDLEAGDNQSLKFKWRDRESNPVPLSLNRIYFHIRHNTYTIQKYAFQGIEKQV